MTYIKLCMPVGMPVNILSSPDLKGMNLEAAEVEDVRLMEILARRPESIVPIKIPIKHPHGRFGWPIGGQHTSKILKNCTGDFQYSGILRIATGEICIGVERCIVDGNALVPSHVVIEVRVGSSNIADRGVWWNRSNLVMPGGNFQLLTPIELDLGYRIGAIFIDQCSLSVESGIARLDNLPKYTDTMFFKRFGCPDNMLFAEGVVSVPAQLVWTGQLDTTTGIGDISIAGFYKGRKAEISNICLNYKVISNAGITS